MSFFYTFHLFPNPASSIFMIYHGVFIILWIALLLFLLLRLLFTLKLINCNSLLLNLPGCYSNKSSSTCSHFCCLCRQSRHPNSKIASYNSYSEISPLSYNKSRSSSLITLKSPSVTSGLKSSNKSVFLSAPVVWNSLPSHLRHAAQLSLLALASLTSPSLSLSKQ